MINSSCLQVEINSIIYRPVACAWCKATGRRDSVACAACNGQGSVLAAHPACQCPHCNGDGHEPLPEYAAHLACVVCHGSGWVLTIDRPAAD
jgi:DnaJ-class molecular chaperone